MTQGCDFLSLIVETLSITRQKMAATVYERDNCNGDGTRERQNAGATGLQLESQCLISRFVENGNRRQQLSFSFHELKSLRINEIG